jgi:hypothetical protein
VAATALGSGHPLHDHLEMSADGRMAVVGVADAVVVHPDSQELVSIGAVAVDAEFGTVVEAPNSVFARAAFQHGEDAAMAAAAVVGRALAGEAVAVAVPSTVGQARPPGPSIRRAGTLGRDIDNRRSSR